MTFLDLVFATLVPAIEPWLKLFFIVVRVIEIYFEIVHELEDEDDLNYDLDNVVDFG